MILMWAGRFTFYTLPNLGDDQTGLGSRYWWGGSSELESWGRATIVWESVGWRGMGRRWGVATLCTAAASTASVSHRDTHGTAPSPTSVQGSTRIIMFICFYASSLYLSGLLSTVSKLLKRSEVSFVAHSMDGSMSWTTFIHIEWRTEYTKLQTQYTYQKHAHALSKG